jgi:hypothetical protein
VKVGLNLKLIDLDACAKIGLPNPLKRYSSGYLPPEAFCIVDGSMQVTLLKFSAVEHLP